MWSFGNTIRCPWVFVHQVNAVNMSRSLTLPMTWLKNDYPWGTRSLHEALRQRPLFQIAACPAKWKFIQLWWEVMWFPYQTGSYFTWSLNQKSGIIFAEFLLLNLWTQTKTAIHMGGQKVLWNLVSKWFSVPLFPWFISFPLFPWRMTGVVRFMTCNRHDLIHREPSKFVQDLETVFRLQICKFVVFLQNNWMWVNKFGFKY